MYWRQIQIQNNIKEIAKHFYIFFISNYSCVGSIPPKEQQTGIHDFNVMSQHSAVFLGSSDRVCFFQKQSKNLDP